METLTGNWRIEKSEKYLVFADERDSVLLETISNPGTLVIFEGTEGDEDPPKESRLYDFTFIDSNNDTLMAADSLVSDSKNLRLIFKNAIIDSTSTKNLVWTVEKKKKKKQQWVTYGVDSTLFYPLNNNNPGAADNWIVWRIYLKKD